tara:strand:- start:591 stop:764 length:174 start_codon:yes stop_codon:yes gene_type:complete
MKLTAYAKQLLQYVQAYSPKQFDAERYLDTYIPDWRNRKRGPKAKRIVVIDDGSTDN